MFGFFKKKSGEVPEEQERLRQAEERRAAEQKAAERAAVPAEVPPGLQKLGKKFLLEEWSILAVTGANGFGGEQDPDTGLWTAEMGLTAWKEEDGDEPARRGNFLLVALADDKLLSYLRRRVLRDSVVQVKVRPSEDFSTFLMLELPQPETDGEMKAILEEQKKPVVRQAPGLGDFTLNRSLGWFEAEVDWMGQTARLDIDQEENWDPCVEHAKALLAAQTDWDGKVRAFAAQALLDLANQWAQQDQSQEEPEEITQEQFIERMELDAIQVDAAGGVEFWFNDGDLFWGHAIHVTGSLDKGPETAEMEE